MGSSGDVGTPPIKGTRMCAMSPGGLAEGPGAGLTTPERSWAEPRAPALLGRSLRSLRGDLGFPTCPKPIAEVW